MITDRENTFADNLLVTATGVVGDVVKVGNRLRNPELQAYLQVETALNNLTSLQFKFVSSATSDLASPNVMYDSGAVALATLNAAAGYRAVAPMGPIPSTHLYVGWTQTLVGTAPAAGGLTAGVVEAAALETDSRATYYTGL